MSTKPFPHGTEAAVEFAGVLKLPLLATTLFSKIVQRAMLVDAKVGIGEVLSPESHEPSCGGGWSSLLSEFGPMPFELCRKIESRTSTWPPAFVPEYPSALFSTSRFDITASQSRHAPR